MHRLMAVLIVSVLWLCPLMIEAGTAGTTGEQRPEQHKMLTKDNLKGAASAEMWGEPGTVSGARHANR
jgi:hypothetical protein